MVSSLLLQSTKMLLFRPVSCGVGRFLLNTNISSRCRFFASDSNASRLFTDKHEWIIVNDNIGTVGISQHAQDSLGDIVYAELPSVGTSISQDAECGALESVKAASELFSPVSGEIVEKNSEVEKSPGLINKSCYEKGWLFKVKITNSDELSKLMDDKQYEEFLKSDQSN